MKRSIKLIYWMFLIMTTLFLGYLYNPIDPKWSAGGVIGFRLGIVGSILMLLSLIYTIFKRLLKSEKLLGNLDIHIITGCLGTILIIFHGNFSVRGISGVALVSLILIFVSGVLGELNISKFQYIFKHWDYLHIAFSIVLVFSSLIHIIAALLFHRGLV